MNVAHRIIVLSAFLVSCSDTPPEPLPDAGPPEDSGPSDARESADADPVCAGPGRESAQLTDPRGTVDVTAERAGDCRRTYRVASSAQRRDGEPASPRTVTEQAAAPALRTGNVLLDGLYALALEEVRENSVDAISDGAFNSGAAIACPGGGCFETGAEWHYVWTRDISYATDLGLADLDPVRARNSLQFKVSERHRGGDAQVMQDTGTGGGYPVSSDRVVWALGAVAVVAQLPELEAQAFASEALDVLVNTLQHDRAVVFDPRRNLYRGEQSFLDWREQSYPAWVAGDPGPIASSHALSTNLLHLRAMQVVESLASYTGRDVGLTELPAWRSELQTGLQQMWNEDAGLYGTLMMGRNSAPVARQFDLLGSSLSVLFGLADERAGRVIASYPHFGVGAPVISPQQQFTPIYHNRSEWPFVSAYWLRAAAAVGNDAVAARMFETLIRGAGLNLSNMENWEISSGAPWVEDGEYSGPVVNSRRQLWSVAGFVSMVHHTLFGLQPSLSNGPGLDIRPALPRAIRAAYLSDSETLTLAGYSYRGNPLDVVLNLPADPGGDGFYAVSAIRVDGEVVSSPIPASALRQGSIVEVDLALPVDAVPARIAVVDDADWQQVFAPRSPAIDSVSRVGDELEITFSSPDAPTDVSWNVFVGDVMHATLPGETGSTRFELPANGVDTAWCFTVEACFTSSGTCSHRSQEKCWWGEADERITVLAPSMMTNEGGELSQQQGREHWSQWGDAGHLLTIAGVRPDQDASVELQVLYGNGAGAVETGVTCGIKRLLVTDEMDGSVVAERFVVMPHLGDWAIWSLSPAVSIGTLDASRTYRIELSSDEQLAVNMSSFKHFGTYTGGPGNTPFNRVNVAEIRLLSSY